MNTQFANIKKYFDKKIWNKPMRFIVVSFILWRLYLQFALVIGQWLLPQKENISSLTPWANFDGLHYLSIAKNGYGMDEYIFFPLYPYLIRAIAFFLGNNYMLAGLIISNVCFLLVLYLLFVISNYINKKRILKISPQWVVIGILIIPTSFYFTSIYTESLALLLILLSFYMLLVKHKGYRLFYAVSASLASATRFIGAFLLVPIGFILYAASIHKSSTDVFSRNGAIGELVLLPQVVWRYVKIFGTVSYKTYDFWIAFVELAFLTIALFAILWCFKTKLPKFWLYFSLASLILPTLAGSFSSSPRYILVLFPLYFVFAMLNQKHRSLILVLSILLLGLFTALFTRGFWIG